MLLHLTLLTLFVAGIAGFLALRRESREMLHASRILALFGALLALAILVRRGVEMNALPIVSKFDAHLLVGALTILLAVTIDLLRSLPILTIASVPLAFSSIVFAAAIGVPQASPGALERTPTTNVHAILVLLSYVSFGIAFVTSILYLIEQRNLKSRTEPSILGLMPSLETSYRFTRRALFVGVLLLTVGAVLGYQEGRQSQRDSAWRTSPIVWVTTVAWVAYIVIMALSFLPKLKGRRTALASAVCFVLTMTASWVTAFWSDFHRH